MISIICPILNEEQVLLKNAAWFKKLSGMAELIFVDGGSADKSVAIAGQYAKVVCGNKGRAAQMNSGAGCAQGDILLFLHADTSMDVGALGDIEKKIAKEGCIGGCLTQRIDKTAFIYRLIETLGNVRAKISRVFYGDQGIFVRKDVFERLGGFPDVPIFEDVLFTRKLKCEGKTIVLSDKIMVSARRWEKTGIFKTTLMFSMLLIRFKMGHPLDKIKALYEDLR